MGDITRFKARSNGFPMGLTPEKAVEMLRNGFKCQSTNGRRIADLNVIKASVLSILDEAEAAKWRDFFDLYVPKTPNEGKWSEVISDSWLHKLYAEFGGPPRRKCRKYSRKRRTVADIADAMTWSYGSLTAKERESILSYAQAVDKDKTLLIETGDVTRVYTKQELIENFEEGLVYELDLDAPETPQDDKAAEKIVAGGKRQAATKPATKQAPRKAPRKQVSIAAKKTPAHTVKKKPKKNPVDDEASACSSSTGISSYAPSMLSRDDSDLSHIGFLDEGGNSDVDSRCSGISTDYSYTPREHCPIALQKKHEKEYWSRVGARFFNPEDNITYQIINVVTYDNMDGSLGSRLSYRYRPTETNDDDEANIDISLCSEMVDCDWVQWL